MQTTCIVLLDWISCTLPDAAQQAAWIQIEAVQRQSGPWIRIPDPHWIWIQGPMWKAPLNCDCNADVEKNNILDL